MSNKYCVRCGRNIGEDEPYINGYCIDCFLKYRGIFITRPVIEVSICSRCGAWRFKGQWNESLPIREILRRIFLREAYRFLQKGLEIVDVEILTEPYKVNEAEYAVRAVLQILVHGEHIINDVESEIIVKLTRTVCPRCISYAGKIHRALVQVRGVDGSLSDEEKRFVRTVLSDPAIISEVVEIKENRYGYDIKFISSVAAKRFSTILNRLKGAKVTESFKPTKYNPDKGKWTGITTLSVRFPSLKIGDLVEYRGKPGVIKDVKSTGVDVELLDNGQVEHIKYDAYWRGELSKPGYMSYGKIYSVIARDKSTVYLLNDETGEMKEYPLTKYLSDIKEGDKIRFVRVKDK
ncbi:MAG: 60S ribosomal export protein NMD3, partial [Staphylothermus sp.]|nr:60S ribosomal export protein NMD3 [Staphylothermus sp.]